MILSFDPGVHIGVVAVNNINYITREYDLLFCGVVMFPQRKQLRTLIAKQMYKEEIEAIIIEDFALSHNIDLQRAQAGSKFEAVAVKERIICICEDLILDDRIVIQTPAYRKSAINMPEAHHEILKGNRHTIAAYQHMRAYIFAESNHRKRLI
jgi:hypothetical protein